MEIDARFPAVRVLREDQVSCAVARAVVGPPAQIIIELVRGARPAAKFGHDASGAAAQAAWGYALWKPEHKWLLLSDCMVMVMENGKWC